MIALLLTTHFFGTETGGGGFVEGEFNPDEDEGEEE